MKCYLCRSEVNKDGTPVKYYKCNCCQSRLAREAYGKDPEKFKKRKREFKKNNPERCKGYNSKSRRKLKIDALNAYGGCKCACCGIVEIDFLCLDHVDNDGAEHRKMTGGGGSFYFYLRKNNYPTDIRLQTFCYNCNNSKKIHGECIHKITK